MHTATLADAAPHTDETRPLVTQFTEAMWRHDRADNRFSHDEMAREMEIIRGIELKALIPRAMDTMPDAMHSLCLARYRLSDTLDEQIFDGEAEAAMIDVEYLIDAAIFGICRATGFDLKSWRLNYYARGHGYPMRRQAAEAEAA